MTARYCVSAHLWGGYLVNLTGRTITQVRRCQRCPAEEVKVIHV